MSPPTGVRRVKVGRADFPPIAEAIGSALGTWVAPQPAAPVHGGSISDGFRWESGTSPLFVKVGPGLSATLFEREQEGLEALAKSGSVTVPKVLARGRAGSCAFLVLEWLELRSLNEAAQAELGTSLAQLHRQCSPRFGWEQPNFIGRTPQPNAWMEDWTQFFAEQRLRFQLELACRNGHATRLRSRGEELLASLPGLLDGHRPQPSLLHGDLWAGNAAMTMRGSPVVFDPAVYYGDREADLAMTRLFGGFGPAFYEAYEAAWPLPPGAEERADLYNLYHVLNHLNLFGAGYLGQVQSLIDILLARVGS